MSTDLSSYINLFLNTLGTSSLSGLAGSGTASSLTGLSGLSESSSSSFLPLLLMLYQNGLQGTQGTENVQSGASGTSAGSAAGSAAFSTEQQKRLNDLLPCFEEAEQKTGVSKKLLEAVAEVESGFDTNTSCGVMALIPTTQKAYGVTDVNDARQNILAGAQVLKDHLDRYGGDVKLALAAYNAGSGAVEEAGGVPSYTDNYVSKVLSVVDRQGGLEGGSAYTSQAGTGTAASAVSSSGGLSLNADQLQSLLALYELQMEMRMVNTIGSFGTSSDEDSSLSLI